MQRVAHQVFTKPFILAFFDYLGICRTLLVKFLTTYLTIYHLLEIKEYLKFNE